MVDQKEVSEVLSSVFDDKDIGSCAVLDRTGTQVVGKHPIELDIWLARCHSAIYHLARQGMVVGPNVRDMLMIRKTLPVPFGEFRATMLVFDNHTIMLYPLPNGYMFYASVRHGVDNGIPLPVLEKVRNGVKKLIPLFN